MSQKPSARLARAVAAAAPSALWMAATGQRSMRFNTPPVDPPPANPPKQDPPAQPKKLELTEEELQARLEAAKKEERDTAASAKKKADDLAAEEDAKKKGEFQKLADQEKSKREAAEAANASLRVDLAIRDRLADEKYAGYGNCAKYIKPLIDTAVADDADKLDKSVTAAVDQYVKDNPRAPKGGPTPPPGRSGVRGPANSQQQTQNQSQDAPSRDRAFLNRFKPPARFNTN